MLVKDAAKVYIKREEKTPNFPNEKSTMALLVIMGAVIMYDLPIENMALYHNNLGSIFGCELCPAVHCAQL
jgi:hypothetical protein